MFGLKVTIERFIDECQPGWVECTVSDASGGRHTFREKVPVVSHEELTAESHYPRIGIIGCKIVGTSLAQDGRELVIVDTELPWGVEAVSGETRFEVFRGQIEEVEQVVS